MASRYTLIKGSFPIVGTEPDGDTIRFAPDTPAIVETLGPPGQKPKFSQGGTQISVRFEAIDALETHFSGTRQQVRLGDLATARMLAILGFASVDTSGTKVDAATPPSIRGYVAANSLDSYGRMIAFVFGGEVADADGSDFFLDVPKLAESVNVHLLAEGVVYPAFYTTLPVDLKDHLAAQTRVVRERAVGVWPEDAPSVERAADLPNLAAAEALVMWPKLFRRLATYFKAGNAGLGGFDAWLRQDQKNRDDFLQLPNGEFGNMHDLVAVTGNSMRLKFRPEDVVVLPDTFVPGPVPSPDPSPGPGPDPTPVPVPTPVPADVTAMRIIAALVNPTGQDAGHETVTLLNTSPASVDLTGWHLRDRQIDRAGQPGLPLGGTVAAGDTLRVPVRAPVAFGNAGDDIVLADGQGNIVHRVTYDRKQAAAQGVTLVF